LFNHIISSKAFLDHWVYLKHSKRRLLKFGGDVTETGLVNIQENALPVFFQNICKYFQENVYYNGILPNHILLNDYP
jgi:hypothetical protein